MIRVALDAMGGDQRSRSRRSRGAVQALTRAARRLPGPAGRPRRARSRPSSPAIPSVDRSRLEIHEAADVIGMSEKPLRPSARSRSPAWWSASPSRRDGQVRRVHLRRQHRRDARRAPPCCSACTTASSAPPWPRCFPPATSPVLVLDGGANVDCSARELVGFAYLGTVYMRDVLGRPNRWSGCSTWARRRRRAPRSSREAHQLLKQAPRLNYVGNIEGRDILPGPQQRHAGRRGGLRRLRRQHRAQVLRIVGAGLRRPR